MCFHEIQWVPLIAISSAKAGGNGSPFIALQNEVVQGIFNVVYFLNDILILIDLFYWY